MTISARYARDINFVDDVLGGDAAEFDAGVVERAERLARDRRLRAILEAKSERRRADERRKPLAAYRAEELASMSRNFFGPNPAYHDVRRRFVRKSVIAERQKAIVEPR